MEQPQIIEQEIRVGSTSELGAYVSAFASAMRRLPYVDRVLADYTHGVTLYTVYAGDLDDLADDMFEAQGQVMDQYPECTVDFRFVSVDGLTSDIVPPTACVLG